MGYSQAVEKVMDIKIPERAEYLRVLWAELSRIHSHVLWLGLLSDALGFESLFMQCFRIREKVLNIFEMTTGGRVIFSVCKVGGVRKDINLEKQKVILNILKEVEKELKEIEVVFFDDLSVKKRLVGVGVLSKEEAYELGCVGPMARASGIDYDDRNLGYSAYKDIEFKTIIDNKGDSYSRCVVRFKEIFESINIIRQVIDRMPDGEISIKVNGNPNGEYFARLEQPRGEVIYHIKGNGTKFLGRMRVRTPTFANMPALFKILQGCDLADVPILILTIDPCISCTER